MNVNARFLFLLAAALPSLAFAQPVPPPAPLPAAEPTPQRSSLRTGVDLQFFSFGNFFQVGDGLPQQNVNALGAAYRAYLTRPANTPDLYGRVSLLRYSGDASETSYTGQVGMAKYGNTHWFDVALDHTRNGYSYDIEETRATANITTVWGHYSYPIGKNWRVGADTYLDWLRFNIDTGQESNYQSLIAVARYNGFRVVKPRVGYAVGRRDSRDNSGDLDDRYWYVQLATNPIRALELSVRYQDRTIEYPNVQRTDDRSTWQLRASYKQNDRLTWVAWYRPETVDSSRPGRDFDRSTGSVTLTWWF